MSFSLANGFSDGALTPTRAVAAGLFIGGAVVIALWTYGGLSRFFAHDPAAAPACFGRALPGNAPRVEMPKRLRAKAEDRLWSNPRGDSLRFEQMAAAEQICTAQSCDRKAWEKYRSALFWYLADRLNRTRRLVEVFGDKGLERARSLFGGADDARADRGLRERYKAGVFRIRDFRQNQDAIAILVLEGGAALRPCRAVPPKS